MPLPYQGELMTWERYIDDDGVCGVRFDDAHSVGWDLEGWCDKCEEYMNLVAAAPELLEALERIAYGCESLMELGEFASDGPFADAIKQALAVIARAKGE